MTIPSEIVADRIIMFCKNTKTGSLTEDNEIEGNEKI